MNKEKLKELAATLNGIAEGKEWERTNTITGQWFCPLPSESPLSSLASGCNIRLKPWSLPPPPDGYEWHCGDEFTESDLDGGWRPLFVGERRQVGDQFCRDDVWTEVILRHGLEPMSDLLVKHRTKRPLPPPQQPDPYAELKAAHAAGKTIQALSADGKWRDWVGGDDFAPREPSNLRIKPETRRVPLCRDDIKGGDEFLSTDGVRFQWANISSGAVIFRSFCVTFYALKHDGWKIRSIGETEWRECSKEEEVEA